MIKKYLDLVDPDGAGFWNMKPEALSLALVAAAGFILYSQNEALRHFLFILDWFNIIIHESGHPIFGMLSLGNRWIMFAGGTMMQLLWPIGCYGLFLYQRNPKSADFCIFWFGSNFLGIGPYMADARAQILPLIGGGEHDWTYLFNSVGLINYDRQIGAAALYFGCFAMACSALTLNNHIRNPKTNTKTATETFS
jgi:hypothetical protein